jgi:hypothetical protein
MRKADFVEWDKGHGRVERRAVWVVGAGELGPCLERELRWPRVRQVGWIRRSSRPVHAVGWQEDKLSTWVSSLEEAKAGPNQIAEGLRGHWAIENKLFHVKDDGFGEDRHVLGSHRSGAVMGLLRGAALNLLRGRSRLWEQEEPLTGRAQAVSAQPLAILGTIR